LQVTKTASRAAVSVFTDWSLHIKSNEIDWMFALSPTYNFVAVLQNGLLEIR